MRITAQGRKAIGDVTAREHQLMGAVPGGITQREIESTLRVLRYMLAGREAVECSQT